MKKLLILVFALVGVAVAQTTVIYGNRDIRGFFDAASGTFRLPQSTVAALPAAIGVPGRIYVVTDGPSCTSGGGSTAALCRSNGTAWVTLGGSGGGGVWGSITGTLGDQLDLAAALGGKEPTIAAGTTAQYWRGDKSWQTLSTAVLAAMSGLYEVPLTFSSGLTRSTNTITCNTASASVFGCLPAADWTTFNGKQAAITGAPGTWPSTFVPSAHASTHASAGSDPVTLAESQITGLTADLAAKAPLASPTFTGTVGGITKSMVGLGSVDNTADASKPVSTAQQAALDLKANLSGGNSFAGNQAIGAKVLLSPTTGLDTTSYIGSILLSGLTGVATWTAGTPGVVAGTSTNCVRVDGTSGTCGGSSAWSALTNPSGALSLLMAHYASTWTYDATTGASANMLTWTDTASNTGTGILGRFTTASGSAMTPWQADANGVGWRVHSDGSFRSVAASGSGTITLQGATSGSCILTTLATGGAIVGGSAAECDLGSAALPFKVLRFAGASGTPASNNFTITGTATGARTVTLPDRDITVAGTTGAITANHCAKFDASGNVVDSGGTCGGGSSGHPLGVVFGDGSATLATSKIAYFTSPYACTIAAWNATVDTGTITFDIWKRATGTAIPTIANTIVASAAPGVSTGTAIHSTTMTGWTTSVTANDIFAVQISALTGSPTSASLVMECN